MDSGNSNSMQSSSGGDEEYDSRADQSISSFLNNNNNSSNYPPPPAPATAHHHHTSLFDPLSSNYTFDPLSSSNPNSLLNLDMVWSKNLIRSEPPNCTDLGGFFIPSTSSSFSSSTAMHHILRGGGGGVVTESVSKTSNASSFLATAGSSGPGPMVRNPKKRSRASRRAPTTVLTTDTTNFRAMVQEFTGIPSPPFTSSSPFPRTRLDLFGSTSSSRSAYNSFHLDSSSLPSPHSYNNILRPFAQKLINPIPFTSSNSMIDATTATTTNISNYQLLQPSQTHLNINMQNNPILNLHSLLQVSPKYPLVNSSILETKPPPPTQGSSLEDLGLSHATAGAAAHLNTNLMSGLQCWPGAGAAAVGTNGNHEELGLFVNGKVSNFSQVASSEFHRDKGQEENVNMAAGTTTRTEGMVESWICSSD